MLSFINYLDFLSETVQEAQLSQRDCATLVIEYFAKSLKVIWNYSVK